MFQRLALRQGQADPPVARQIARRRQDQVAQATKPHKGFCFGTQRQAQPRHFGQPASNEGGARIEAELQAIAQTGGNGHYVFNRTADFHTGHVLTRIDPQMRAMKSIDQGRAHAGMRTCSDQRSGLAQGHFHGKTGAAEHTG